ncbi:MAG: methionine biosynthesis protein MetW [Caulobacterales bacterium]
MIGSSKTIRRDLETIAELTPEGARVLDVGCGEGELLELLTQRRNARAHGLELSQAGVNASVARGLSVVQGDADRDLAFYPNDAFDLVVLSQTIQATRQPRHVLSELLRIGRRVIVSFPNFAHWRISLSLLAKGRMPRTRTLPFSWYDTPNIHQCTLTDFLEMTKELGVRVDRIVPFADGKPYPGLANAPAIANVFADEILLLLSRADEPPITA